MWNCTTVKQGDGKTGPGKPPSDEFKLKIYSYLILNELTVSRSVMFLAPSPNVRLISFAFESSELAKMAWLHGTEQCSYGHDLALITKHTARSWMGIKHVYLWCTHKLWSKPMN